MTDTNHVVLVGRLTKDLGTDERSFGYVSNGQARANISIAVNRSRRNGDQWIDDVNYFDVTIWGKTAENLKPYLTKGKQVIIEGYLKQDRWEKDGQKFSKVTVVANNVQLVGGRAEGGQPTGGAPRFQPMNNSGMTSSMPDSGYSSGYGDPYGDTGMDIPEDIPF